MYISITLERNKLNEVQYSLIMVRLKEDLATGDWLPSAFCCLRKHLPQTLTKRTTTTRRSYSKTPGRCRSNSNCLGLFSAAGESTVGVERVFVGLSQNRGALWG